MAEVKAQLNSLRLAPRKVRAVTQLVKGKDAEKAIEQLEFLVRRPSEPVMKLLKSALANAEHNFGMVRSNLYVKEFSVDEGIKLKRFRPKAFGRAAALQKKTSHVRLVLAERVPGLKAEKPSSRAQAEGKAAATKEHDHDHAHDHSHDHAAKAKPEVKTELGKETSGKGKKRIFQRKSV